ncbi:MAG: amidophosphoribosyltransferase [Armatimonadota bacterium]|nr:amidophosphoribosyltransferase [Armatimonadota bacterium]MDR7452480.1 amidophosphoribosyltransferase [Armatimonadota bacterium]MDR7467332.1 amidophosphoribosyltransferase [Armatimonadota bacterium]MDR7494103.1 amidophosphoribosyltransferase [Armatimonadota bacterium]MDR7498930.1 amidophosphoribosyltransferase [Armatimonadota bacterium]
MTWWESDAPREECGVVGVCATGGSAAPVAHLALYALQHRGQESAGIASSDGRGIWVHRGMGLVSQVFDADRVAGLPGPLAVGHVRYATMGSARLENAQPLVVASPWGPLALAHNGNLINAPLLRAELQAGGVAFHSTTDSEVIAQVIAHAPVPSLEEAVAYAMRRIEGAYTVALLASGRVLGFRDAYGIRPLAIGRSAQAYLLASESCAFDHTGATFVRDVAPGEVVVIDEHGMRSHRLLPARREAQCVFEYIYFARPDTVLAGRNVHLTRRRMGRILAREHPARADVVIAVPDSGTSAALGFAEASGIPFEVGLIKNRYIGRTFIQPDQARRDLGVRLKLNPLREVIDGRRVVLVDDSIVRGTTSGKIVGMLRRAGATEVHVRISSPPIRFPCFYGIDTSSRGELVAASKSVEEIRRMIGADTLGYLSQLGLVEALQLARERLCMACLDGAYPTAVPEEALAGRHALEGAPVG